jgi:dynein heavy chain
VYIGGDIANQLPLIAKKFQQIDKTWMKIMEKASDCKKVLKCIQLEHLKSFLPGLDKDLEECQKSLDEYLETKRGKFSRFYFVSDPVLLVILSQGSNPKAV